MRKFLKMTVINFHRNEVPFAGQQSNTLFSKKPTIEQSVFFRQCVMKLK
jgi:hypothetical protein